MENELTTGSSGDEKESNRNDALSKNSESESSLDTKTTVSSSRSLDQESLSSTAIDEVDHMVEYITGDESANESSQEDTLPEPDLLCNTTQGSLSSLSPPNTPQKEQTTVKLQRHCLSDATCKDEDFKPMPSSPKVSGTVAESSPSSILEEKEAISSSRRLRHRQSRNSLTASDGQLVVPGAVYEQQDTLGNVQVVELRRSTSGSILDEKAAISTRRIMRHRSSRLSSSSDRGLVSSAVYKQQDLNTGSERELVPGAVHEQPPNTSGNVQVELMHRSTSGSILDEKEAISTSRLIRHRSSRLSMSSDRVMTTSAVYEQQQDDNGIQNTPQARMHLTHPSSHTIGDEAAFISASQRVRSHRSSSLTASERQLIDAKVDSQSFNRADDSETSFASPPSSQHGILDEKEAVSRHRRTRHRSSRIIHHVSSDSQIGVGVAAGEEANDIEASGGGTTMASPNDEDEEQSESDDDSRDVFTDENDSMEETRAAVRRSGLVNATLVVEDDSSLVFAEVLSQKHMRRRRFGWGLFVILVVGGLVAIIAAMTTSNNGGSGDENRGDPRCLEPVEAQDIMTQCACLGEISYIKDVAVEKARNMTTFLEESGVFPPNSGLDYSSCDPQNQALWWISDPGNSNIPRGAVAKAFSGELPLLTSELVQRYILVLFYFCMNGDQWDRRDNWLSPMSACTWFGVTCTLSFRATHFDLPANNLEGPIPKKLAFLSHLESINLADNPKISGTLPAELSEIAELMRLNLESLNLVGRIPEEYFSFERIHDLKLNNNSLTGTFPSEISRWQELRVFDIGDNLFNSTLPEITENVSIGVLNIENNQFTGRLPQWIARIKHLKMLKISGNQFSGPLPDLLGKRKPLSILDVSNNMLTGTIPSSIGRLKRLSLFSIAGNSFTGGVPKELCQSNFLDAVVVECEDSFQPPNSNCTCCYCESALFGVFASDYNQTN